MRGEFIGVWPETWRGIWLPLTKYAASPADLFSDLYRDLVPEPLPPVSPPAPTAFDANGEIVNPEDIRMRAEYEKSLQAHAVARARYEVAVNDGKNAKSAFRKAVTEFVSTENEAISILERSFTIIEDYNVESISNKFFILVEGFIVKFSLRYDLRRPFTIHPTLSGVFSTMVRDLKFATSKDAGLHPLMLEFEDAIRDLRSDRSAGKIKSCIQKQVNLLEAIGQRSPGVTGNTLGQICNQIGTWPHHQIKDAMRNLYGFACDYPGIRHGGTFSNQIRDIEMRDLVSVSVLLAGFYPYLTNLIDSNHIYRGT